MEHYFSKNSSTKDEIKLIEYYIVDRTFKFYTNNGVFSKSKIDFGSMVLIQTVIDDVKNFKDSDIEILDVGCGYGPIGISLATYLESSKVTMVDVNDRALELCKKNTEANNVSDRTTVFMSDTFDNVEKNYDVVVTNPPIRAGKDVVHSIYEGAYEHLNKDGIIYVVIQKKQGAKSSQEKLENLFGNCEVIKKKDGYQILRSIKEN